ncbi:MAG: cytidylate kinase-like family protein [Magnetococcales bacterium]|nr:cytidylate kinase-like family protein [Magnetococcales bacterium]
MADDPHKIIQSIIGAQIYEDTQGDEGPTDGPLITISRGFGANGTQIAKLLSEKLNIRFYDRALLREAAKEAQTDPYLMEQLDEQVTGVIDELVHSLFVRHGSKDDFYRAMIKVILTISKSGGGVIVGRGAHLLLPARKALRVRIDGSLDRCVERVTRRLGIKKSRAKELIINTNEDRVRYVRRIFKRYSTRKTYYDLVINSDLYTPEQAVEVIAAAIKAADI